ncbi:MAG: hypothetical protein CVV64_15310 [Candidatus Wallbacteria bacterium HGW-Wallbacteria-1]|jgi:sugar phosphate isomerase/epimerase|uniref:Xylose isomerase-like TIM barrel domain-containing protein n=1 Tax=Candidatus Wallbacteria bacterium HGW-Wallbacteria-1 TaxID=2013854 RepID=A0A2N1PLG1_9BACT|nr:MAG: hypothetical protein CVV64_15310 [Candidatus Wallbacteria bacterium HGW-Wallbacteria-1]
MNRDKAATEAITEMKKLLIKAFPHLHVYFSTSHIHDQFRDPPQPLSRIINHLVQSGAEGIELGTSHTIEELQGGNPETFIQSLMKESVPHIALHNAFPLPSANFVMSLCTADNEQREQSITQAQKGLMLSRVAGARAFGVHPGFLSDTSSPPDRKGFSFKSNTAPASRGTALKTLLDSVEKVIQQQNPKQKSTESAPIFCVENPPLTQQKGEHLILGEPEELIWFAEKAEQLGIGLLLDLGHLRVTAATTGSDPVTLMKKFAPFTRALHISDNDGSNDAHLMPNKDSWFISYLDLFTRCKQITLEVSI